MSFRDYEGLDCLPEPDTKIIYDRRKRDLNLLLDEIKVFKEKPKSVNTRIPYPNNDTNGIKSPLVEIGEIDHLVDPIWERFEPVINVDEKENKVITEDYTPFYFSLICERCRDELIDIHLWFEWFSLFYEVKKVGTLSNEELVRVAESLLDASVSGMDAIDSQNAYAIDCVLLKVCLKNLKIGDNGVKLSLNPQGK